MQHDSPFPPPLAGEVPSVCEAEGVSDPLEQAQLLLDRNRASEAAALLKQRIDEGRGWLAARLLLTRAQIEMGDCAGAVETARDCVYFNPSAAPAALNLGEALLKAGHLPASIGEFQRCLRLDPSNARAQFLLGCAWAEAGEPAKALAELADCEASEELQAMMEELRANLARPRSDPRYVRHLFDQFSADYDVRMIGQLQYRAPQILRELASFVMPGRTGLRILDLGCGTGLAGEAFKPLASWLEGIDLSPAMIERAREQKIYDALALADIETWLAESEHEFDLILAADTLVYLGDLASVFAGAAARLKPEGFFLFTVEKHDRAGFELGPKKRWRHSEAYLTSEAFKAGFAVAGLLECVPRMEAKRAVDGFAVALMRRSA